MGACEPGQVRKEAALSGYFHVPWGCSGLRPYRETISAEFVSALQTVEKPMFLSLLGKHGLIYLEAVFCNSISIQAKYRHKMV